MLKCQRCTMTFREETPEGKSVPAICPEPECKMFYREKQPATCSKNNPVQIYATPNRPIPAHVMKVEVA